MSAAETVAQGDRAEDVAVERAILSIRARKRAAGVFPGLMISGAVWDLLLELFIYRSSNLEAETELISSNASRRDLEALRRRGIICEGARPHTLTLGDGAFEQMQSILAG